MKNTTTQVEYTIVVRDDENKKCYLSLRGHEIVDILAEEENKYIEMSDQERGSTSAPIGSFKPEYGRHMVEGTPFKPYKGCMGCLLETELNMRLRLVPCFLWLCVCVVCVCV